MHPRGDSSRRTRWWLLILALEVGALTTPAVEWAALPLIVSPRLQQADAIVVLGSGVSPGGYPAPWAEERIRYGVHLYRQGYAPRLIFSGGRTHPVYTAPLQLLEWWITGNYAQLEAETYTVFAQERLKMPRRVLELEDRSHTTYENGLWTARLLRRAGWNHVLLVTSPTHMRRALGVFTRLGVRADPAPVPNSLLYGSSPWHRFESWRGLFHEYLGLAYYRVRGRL